MRSVKEIAERICEGENCFCSYDCGIEKKYTIRQLGEGTVCPIAKYNLPKDRFIAKDVIDSWNNSVDIPGTARVCAECEHAYIDEGFIKHTDEDYAKFCLDCPVHSLAEGIMETMAEAMMS